MTTANHGTYRVAFDVLAGIEPITFPASTSTADMADRVRDAFGDTDADVDIDLKAGTVNVSGSDGGTEYGSITVSDDEPTEQPKPDYWLTLADAIRQHADRIATLAGVELKPSYVGLSIQVAGPGNTDPIAGDMVDVIADAFGLTAETGRGATGNYYERRARGKLDALNFSVYAYLPAQPDPEKAALQAEVEQLRAQLAEGGTR